MSFGTSGIFLGFLSLSLKFGRLEVGLEPRMGRAKHIGRWCDIGVDGLRWSGTPFPLASSFCFPSRYRMSGFSHYGALEEVRLVVVERRMERAAVVCGRMSRVVRRPAARNVVCMHACRC